MRTGTKRLLRSQLFLWAFGHSSLVRLSRSLKVSLSSRSSALRPFVLSGFMNLYDLLRTYLVYVCLHGLHGLELKALLRTSCTFIFCPSYSLLSPQHQQYHVCWSVLLWHTSCTKAEPEMARQWLVERLQNMFFYRQRSCFLLLSFAFVCSDNIDTVTMGSFATSSAVSR